MATRPDLPEFRNPMLEEERAPSHEILIERRCLGQTELKVKPGQVGTSNATKPDNLGVLDYAHLRVPLPKDLSGSGIFLRGANRKWPEAYFLMRRSDDGFVSATGMFKAAFPYSQAEEELTEKEYIKSLEAASSEEVAGNVWIDPTKALDLAEEYGIKLWVEALLDPESITHGTNDPNKYIKSPPPFRLASTANGSSQSPETGKRAGGKRSTRGTRSLRSESPVKQSKTPARKIATPRKPRKGRGALTNVDETASVAEEDEINGETTVEKGAKDTVKVEVETSLVPDAAGEEQVESTKVNVLMPASHPNFELPEDAQSMIEKARQMVEEAKALEGSSTTTRSKGKRKAQEMDPEDELEIARARPVKRLQQLEVDLRKERIRRKALMGIVGTLSLGALVPYVLGALPAITTTFGF